MKPYLIVVYVPGNLWDVILRHNDVKVMKVCVTWLYHHLSYFDAITYDALINLLLCKPPYFRYIVNNRNKRVDVSNEKSHHFFKNFEK